MSEKETADIEPSSNPAQKETSPMPTAAEVVAAGTPSDYLKVSRDELESLKANQRKGVTLADTAASSILDPNTYIQMKAIANDFFSSGAAPKSYTNMMQVLFAIQAGYEMGMKPVESLQSLTIINGVISVWGKAVPRRLREHGWSLKYEDGGEGDEQYCTATISKNAEDSANEEYTETVTFKDADQSGYTKSSSGTLKPGWLPGLNRKLKLRYDVLDVLIKTYVPEVFGSAAGTAEVLMDAVPLESKATEKANIEERLQDFKQRQGGKIIDGETAPKPVEKEDA